jgi:hypothetical protein
MISGVHVRINVPILKRRPKRVENSSFYSIKEFAMRSKMNVMFFCFLGCLSFGYGQTYSFKPSVARRQLNVVRAYDINLTPGKQNTVFIPAMMSFYGATNEQVILSSDFEYSVKPDAVEITADNLGMPRKNYRLTWNNPTVSTVNVRQLMKVSLLCRNKLCTKAPYPYPADVLETYKAYLKADPEEQINPDNVQLSSVCQVIAAQSSTAEDAVERICDWINDNVAFESGTRYGSDEAFQTRKANCTSMSKLACAMLRNMQIPCAVVSAKFIESSSGHGFIEVYFPDAGWVFYDLSNWERGFKSLDCLMTVGWAYRKQVDGQRGQWVDGYFAEEKTIGTYADPQAIRTQAIRNTPKTKDVLGVRVAPMDTPASIRIRRRPLQELILDASVVPGVRDYTE